MKLLESRALCQIQTIIDAEFSVLVRSDLKGLGLGRKLLDKMINYAAEHGLQRLTGLTMPNNQGMITLARKLGFDVDIQIQDGIVNLSLTLEKRGITPQKSVSRSHEQAKDAHIRQD